MGGVFSHQTGFTQLSKLWAGLAFHAVATGLVVAAIFFTIPLLTSAPIPWHIFGPMVLIGTGAVVLIRAFFLRKE